MKKLVSLLLVVSCMFLLVGCGKDASSSSSNSSGNTTASTSESAKATADKQVTIDFWHTWANPSEDITIAVGEAIKTIEAEYPHIKINAIATDGEAYKIKIKTAVAAGELPDIFYTWLPGFSQSFVESGNILQLDDYLSQETYDTINMTALEAGNGSFDGIYALPGEIKMGVLYCNTTYFEEYGIKIPDTYDELLTAVQQFNEVGIQPLLAPGKRVWPIMWLYDILAIKSAGSGKSVEALKGDLSFADPAFLYAAEKLKELADNNAFPEGSVGVDRPEADAEFINGNAPMYFMGSWLAPEIAKESSAVAGKVVAKRFPAFGNDYDYHMLGGTGEGYMVANSSEHTEESVLVLERFTQIMAENDAVLFPTYNIERDYSDLDPIFTQLKTLYDESEGFVIWWDTYLEGDAAQTHKDLSMQLFAGRMSPEEFIEEMTYLQ